MGREHVAVPSARVVGVDRRRALRTHTARQARCQPSAQVVRQRKERVGAGADQPPLSGPCLKAPAAIGRDRGTAS